LTGVLDGISNLISPDSKEHLAHNPHFQMKLKPVVDYTSHQDVIAIVRQAITDGKQIEIIYYSATSDMKQKRVIDPYELYFTEGGVILEGFCHTNQRLVEFRVDRIKHIEMLPASIDDAVAEKERFLFKLWLDRELTGSIGNRFLDQVIEVKDDGTSILTAKSTNSFRLLLKVLSYGEHVKILEPESLRKEMDAIAVLNPSPGNAIKQY
jgi:predicted DNA-binding transcriptional regulator YafY